MIEGKQAIPGDVPSWHHPPVKTPILAQVDYISVFTVDSARLFNYFSFYQMENNFIIRPTKTTIPPSTWSLISFDGQKSALTGQKAI
jgi:hypothetical protein